MSFSNDVKKELLSIKLKSSCCKKAFIFGASLASKECGGSLLLKISDGDTADFVINGIKHIFKKDVSVNKISRGFCNMSEIRYNVNAISSFLSLCDVHDAIDEYLKCDGCFSSFIRGVFCACGSISDPHRSFTLELLLPSMRRATLISNKLAENGLSGGIVERKQGYGVFFRNGEAVENFLTVCGANETVFELYNSQIERDIRNYENRATNCVAMNIQRSVGASAKHVSVIENIISAGVFNDMPADLKVSAKLRLENPEMSLSELAGIHKPAISKSGLNHRLAKICEYAEKHGLL